MVSLRRYQSKAYAVTEAELQIIRAIRLPRTRWTEIPAAFCSAHRRRCAAAIARRPATEIRRLAAGEPEVAELPFLPLPSIRRTSAICSSI